MNIIYSSLLDTTCGSGELRHLALQASVMSLGNGRVSRVEGHRSRVEGHRSRVEGHRSRFESRGRGSKVEVEVQKSRPRVKSRGRGSKVEGRNSRVENGKY